MRFDKSEKEDSVRTGQKTASKARESAWGRRNRDMPHRVLQQQLGNQAVQDLVKSGKLQGQLEASRSVDPTEREAEKTPDGVVQMNENSFDSSREDVQGGSSSRAAQLSGRPVGKLLRSADRQQGTEADGRLDEELARAIQRRRGRGRPLPEGVRREAESAFGTDLSYVQVHTDECADHLAQRLHAKAFTVGDDIFFRSGMYAPSAHRGRQLLGHELTHAIQQGATSHGPTRVDGSSAVEQKAERAGRAFALSLSHDRNPASQDGPESEFRQTAMGRNIVSRSQTGRLHTRPRVLRQPVAEQSSDQVLELSGSVEEEVNRLHGHLWRSIKKYHRNWKTGLNNFETTMSFEAGDQFSAESDALGVAIAKGLFRVAIASAVGPASPAIATAIRIPLESVTDTAFEQGEETPKAGQGISDFITNVRSTINNSKNTMEQEFFGEAEDPDTGQKERITQSFRQELEKSPEPSEDETGQMRVYGPAAEWIQEYRGAVGRFRSRIPSANQFRGMITEEFARSGERTGYITRDTLRASGTLRMDVTVTRERADGDWEILEIDHDEKWTLYAGVPKPENVAKNLQRALEEAGEPPMTGTSLRIEINLTVHTEGEGFWPVKGQFIHGNGTQTVKAPPGDEEAILWAIHDPEISRQLLEITDIRA